MTYTPTPLVLQRLKDVVKQAESQAQAELYALQNALRTAQDQVHGEIHADGPAQYAQAQAERLGAVGKSRLMLSAFDARARTAELLNDKTLKPLLQDAFPFLEKEFRLYDARRRETILERVAKFIANLDEESQPEPTSTRDLGVYAPTILQTPKQRLETIREQVGMFPADWPFERLSSEMCALYEVLIEPAKAPKPEQLPLKRISTFPPGLM